MIFSKKNKSPQMRDRFQNPLFTIGKHSYGEPTILTYDKITRLVIGRYSSFSDKVTILLGGNHRADWVTTYPFPAFSDVWPEADGITGHPASKGDITIGNDVWVGYGATILSGVTIGDGAVVGAMAVVSKDVPPYAVVAGNPAVELRKRFNDSLITRLLDIAWWNWPEDKIRENINLLCSDRVEELTGGP